MPPRKPKGKAKSAQRKGSPQTRPIPPAPAGEPHCVHCHALLGELHGDGCLYAGPPLEADRRRTGVSGLVTRADCEGRGVVHTNASLGLLGGGASGARRGRSKGKALGPRRLKALADHAAALVEDGHSEGSMMFELLDEIDRLEGRPARMETYAKARGWLEEES